MSHRFQQLGIEAYALWEKGRLLPAVEAMEEARRQSANLLERAVADFTIGIFRWGGLGDGERARDEFLTTIADCEGGGGGDDPRLRKVYGDALENAMLCALSFAEFEDLASRLRAVAPDERILSGLVPQVRTTRDQGASWAEAMLSIADTYYNRNDPSRDKGRYGEARATYQLLLTHRRDLRLSRDDWRMAIFEYCALSMRMAADCAKLRGGERDPHSREEFLPLLTEALPLVDEYLREHTGDADLRKVRIDMQAMVIGLRQTSRV